VVWQVSGEMEIKGHATKCKTVSRTSICFSEAEPPGSQQDKEKVDWRNARGEREHVPADGDGDG